MQINPDANEELDGDTSDTAEPPLTCDWCAKATDHRTPVEDCDPSVGYYDVLRLCDTCLESRRRP